MKRGAYFFVLDAIMGGAIFLITAVIILGSYMNTPQTRQTFLLAEDIMGLLLTTKVIDYRHSYITELEDKGLITNPEQTVFQLIAEYHYTNNTNISYNITKKILESLIAEQYGISYMIGNETIYNRSIERFNNSRFALTSRKIAFLSVNQSIFFGPEIAELKIWS